MVLAPNAWKECMSAHEAAAAMRQGVLRADASAEIREASSIVEDETIFQVPLGDGGDGTLDLIVKHKHGQIHEMMVPHMLNICFYFKRLMTQYFGKSPLVSDWWMGETPQSSKWRTHQECGD